MATKLQSSYFKKVLPFRGDNEGKYWVLFWYGRSFFNFKKNRIYKELVLLEIDDINYYVNNWKNNDSNIKKISIPEEKSFLFPLGSIFTSNGRLHIIPSTRNAGIYNNRGNSIEINIQDSFFETGLFNILSNTDYPLYQNGIERIYERAPYYKQRINNISYIIPIQVVNSFFYYTSTLCIYHLISGNIIAGFKEPFTHDGEYIVPFYGNLMRYQEAKLLARYFFIVGNRKINYLKDFFDIISSNLIRDRLSKFYIGGKIPFNRSVNINILGQFITKDKDKQEKFFLVNRITNVSFPIEKFFVRNYKLLNLEDTRSLLKEEQNVKNYTNINYHSSSGASSENEAYNNMNNAIPIKDNIISNDFELFLELPDDLLIDKKDQFDRYLKNKDFIKEIDKLDINYQNHSPGSNGQRVNLGIEDCNSYFELFSKALDVLNSRDGFKISYILLEDSRDDKYSYPPIYSEYIGILLIAQIEYFSSNLSKSKNYCIIEPGFGSVIALFRYSDAYKKFGNNDDTIKKILKRVLGRSVGNNENLDEKFWNWKDIFKNNSLKQNKVVVLKPLNHPKNAEEDEIKAINSLVERIESRIIQDSQ